MKRLAAIALCITVFALPACAQRSFSRGGFSSHASAFRGGFTAARPYRFAGAAHYTGGGYFYSRLTDQRRRLGNFEGRPGYNWRRLYRPRRPRLQNYGIGAYYVVPDVAEWADTDYLDYADTGGYDDSAGAPDYAPTPDNPPPEGYEGEPERHWPSLYSVYQPSSEPPQPSSPGKEEAVTLIFKNGRPSLRIYNYALTATTLYVLDKLHRDIPVAQLDMAATEKVNADAGVNFQLPENPPTSN